MYIICIIMLHDKFHAKYVYTNLMHKQYQNNNSLTTYYILVPWHTFVDAMLVLNEKHWGKILIDTHETEVERRKR